jgi:xylose isomerase
LLKQYNLVISNILVTNWWEPKYKHGAFSTNDKQALKDSIQMCKDGIDFSREAGADSVLFWPAHDGFDYPFQVNYEKAWDTLVESMIELAEYAKDIRLAAEPKPKDPRQKMFLNNTGTLLNLIREVNRPNFGGALDIGHSIAAQENMAESLVMLQRIGKLYQVHLNDNYKDADPDMIVGTINFFETLEMFYYLIQTDFTGWCSIDTIVPRDDRFKSLKLACDMVYKYMALAKKLLEHDDELKSNMHGYRFADNMQLISELVLNI